MEPAGVGWQFSDNFIKVIYLTSLQVSTVRDSSISTIWPAVGEVRTEVEEVEGGEPAGGRAVRDPQSRTPCFETGELDGGGLGEEKLRAVEVDLDRGVKAVGWLGWIILDSKILQAFLRLLSDISEKMVRNPSEYSLTLTLRIFSIKLKPLTPMNLEEGVKSKPSSGTE